jgi:hypothetical protein
MPLYRNTTLSLILLYRCIAVPLIPLYRNTTLSLKSLYRTILYISRPLYHSIHFTALLPHLTAIHITISLTVQYPLGMPQYGRSRNIAIASYNHEECFRIHPCSRICRKIKFPINSSESGNLNFRVEPRDFLKYFSLDSRGKNATNFNIWLGNSNSLTPTTFDQTL